MLNLFGKSKTEPLQFNWQETPTGIRFTAPLDSLSVTEYAEKPDGECLSCSGTVGAA